MKARPAGEAPAQRNAVYEGPMPRAHKMGDPPDKTRPCRRCARCGKKFKPTLRRRMLCLRCFGLGGGYDD